MREVENRTFVQDPSPRIGGAQDDKEDLTKGRKNSAFCFGILLR
jgi:hypothetical protein